MICRCLALVGTASLVLTGTVWALQGHDTNPDFPAIPFDHKAIQYAERPAQELYTQALANWRAQSTSAVVQAPAEENRES